MGSIPPEIARGVANDVAFELGRPWRVGDLREEERKACRTAVQRVADSGLSGEQAVGLVRNFIYERVKQAGKGKDALPPDQSKPSPEQVDAALGVFSTEQWGTLIDSLDQASTRALLSHIRRDKDGLAQRLGTRKARRIEAKAIMRDTELWLAENRSKLVPISDPFWAAFWRRQARQANRIGKGHPANGRSMAKQTSDRSIARRLTKRDEQTGRKMAVSPYEIRKWRERMKSLPFERYAAETGADDEEKRAAAFIGYLKMIRTKHQRKN